MSYNLDERREKHFTGMEDAYSVGTSPLFPCCRSPLLLALILTHIFLDSLVERNGMEEAVISSALPPGFIRLLAKSTCKMWVRIRLLAMGYSQDTPLNLKDSGQYTSWGRLAAASGIIGVTFNHRASQACTRLEEPTSDIEDAISYIRTILRMLMRTV